MTQVRRITEPKFLVDFLKTKRRKADLRTALSVIREFKDYEGSVEWAWTPFEQWVKLEQLEEFLDHLVNKAPLKEDTLRFLKRREGK